ncbi:SUKH-4 family immunity protein [Streptomyces sp. NPDC002888]|uniref:SUKH-4 family immunity protein n=1 Tax=Streptomyces sp. NPDC002888 TaxID=3364668 RepID=UPI0036CBEDE4
MTSRYFELSRDDLVQTFGAEHVRQVPLAAAQAAGFTGEALALLANVGLPENQFISFPDFDDADTGFQQVSLEELGATWHWPSSAANWVYLGNFEISAIVMDTQTGEVHQLAEGIMRPLPLHADLSSLLYTITELTKIVGSLPEDYEDNDEFLEGLEETVDGLKSDVSLRDANPFGSEHSEWVEIVTNIGAGMWG